MANSTLSLADGTSFGGEGFGAARTVTGEVVFNTGMAGYVESLTDPSYRGQSLVLTYPLIGNYGVPAPRATESLEPPYESNRIQVQGLIVQDYVDGYSHHAARRSLREWLVAENIPAITNIDTRMLTRRLREHGTMIGWLHPEEQDLDDAKKTSEGVEMTRDVFLQVAPSEPVHYEAGDLTIMLVDVGAKDNIVRSLLKRGASVLRVPFHADLSEYLNEVDGVLIGNGPGDPEDLAELTEQIRTFIKAGTKPLLGICLGHQILALAAGAKTYKLPYGHRGVNQPVQDLLTRRCFITSQNHGYAVDSERLPDDWEPWFVNINDGTNEGIRSLTKPFASVQFHPEARPGPEDTGYLFDDFLKQVRMWKQG
ncbi:MAG: glutamine-hydrolyzing carbamoyl-phosphate synthase small subunit [Gammaproteobacteria bacterium]|nr:glutamine-hydrolyzing carbamoyl-phosphate synthase small subunit [Gammaproteobacteria bacterium]